MICNRGAENFIILYVYNFKRDLLDFYKKDSVFNIKNIVFIKKNYIKINFTDDYYFVKESVCLFFNAEEINYEIVFVKYKNNFFDYIYFEEILKDCTDNKYSTFEDLIFLLSFELISKRNKTIFFIFFIHTFILRLLNLKKCLLFIKQLQN